MSVSNNNECQLFRGYMSLGLVCDGSVPAALEKRGTATFLTVAAGKSFIVYDCSKFNMVALGPTHEHKIHAITVHNEVVFTAVKNIVCGWIRTRLIFKIALPFGRVRGLAVLGQFLIAYGENKGDKPHVIDITAGKVHTVLDTGDDFETTCAVHPPTYVNKFVFGSAEGKLKLFNINSGKLLYTFECNGNSITCLGQTPALDVISVGTTNGDISLLHLKAGKVLFSLKQDTAVTALDYRSDVETRPLLLSGRSDGRICIWDLSDKSLVAITQRLHNAPLKTMIALKGEPLVITAGSDNAVNLWIFDNADSGIPRLLKGRSGHSQPPSKIRFFGNKDSRIVLSIAPDRSFRITSVFRGTQSAELSQHKGLTKKAAKFNKTTEDFKFSPCIDFDSCTARTNDWCDAVTCHANGKVCRWSVLHKRIVGEPFSLRGGKATKCCISPCGNFGYVGTITGLIIMFNMQSGLVRNVFKAHKRCVTALVVDNINKTLITAGMDGFVKFWELPLQKVPTPVHVIDLAKFQNAIKRSEGDEESAQDTYAKGERSTLAVVTSLVRHDESGLVCAASDDGRVCVIDPQVGKIVRVFSGHGTKVNDICFSANGRWVISAGQDATVRVWDIPTGRMIDWFSAPRPVTSLTFSPSGEFLVTAHAGKKEIYLWSNQDYFSSVLLHAPSALPPEAPLPVPKELLSKRGDENAEEDETKKENEAMDVEGGDESKERSKKLIRKLEGTAIEDAVDAFDEEYEDIDFSLKAIPERQSKSVLLTTLPKQAWDNIANLEQIKERNKPVEPVQAPKDAPFFLPTLSSAVVSDSVDKQKPFIISNTNAESTELTDDVTEKSDDVANSSEKKIDSTALDSFKGSKVLQLENIRAVSAFEQKLEESDKKNDYSISFEYLLTLGPAAADVAWRSLPDYEELVNANKIDGTDAAGNKKTKKRNAKEQEKQVQKPKTREDELLIEAAEAALRRACKCLEYALENKVHFQMVQAHLQHFLKIHGKSLSMLSDGIELLDGLLQKQQSVWSGLEKLLQTSLCMVSYCSGIQA